MSEKRYSLGEVGCYYTKLIIDNETKHELGNSIVVKILNEHQFTIGKLEKENEQLRKIGVMYQGYNPCETCTYSLENKVCCAESIPIFCDDAKKNFIQGLCKNHKQFQKSISRYDDE